MARFVSRLAAAFIFAVVVAAALPMTALGSAPWLTGCSGAPSTYQLCIFSDWHWEGYRGRMMDNPPTNNVSYVGETYPGTGIPVNDTISSNLNLYSTFHVLWFVGINGGGDYLCTPANTGGYTLGYLNDNLSSHYAYYGPGC